MSDNFTLKAMARKDVGKGASRRLRRCQDQFPAIIYGSNKEPMMIAIAQNVMSKALENEAFYSHILTLNVDGKTEKVVLKDLQRHPYEPRFLHADFLRISASEKITMQVPVHVVGDNVAPGVKQGGIVSHQVTSLEIRCMPGDLPEFIEVDISSLELDHTVHLSDLTAPHGVEFMDTSHDNDPAIAAIHLPRAAKMDDDEVTGEGDADKEANDKA